MKFIRHLTRGLWISCGFASSLLALEYDPWIPPPCELDFDIAYLYTWQDLFQSPAGSFNQPGSVHQAQASFELTPLSRWDTQVGFDFGADSSLTFNYAATHLVARYQLLDENEGALISFVPGAEVIFAQEEFVNDNNFYYIGPFNALFSCSIGKSFFCKDQDEWKTRIWLYQAYGIGNQGKPWVVGAWNFEWKLASYLTWAWYSLFSFGTGKDDIFEDLPFTGYGSIDYQFVDLYTSFNYDLPKCGASLSLCAYHNLYARNSSKNYYGGCVSLTIPLMSHKED